MPLISIILPTYNVEKYIARALESCINQTLKDIEIIVVDDKGQDNSIDIAKNYASNDIRIRIIDNIENKGTYEARNNGARNAKSPLLMFLDPDDELELNACEIINNIYGGGQKCVDMICFNARFVGKNKEEIIEVFSNNHFSSDNFHKFIHTINAFWNLCFKCIKKDVYINAINTIHTTQKIKMAEDALAFYLSLNFTNNIISINNALYKYYINDESITNANNSEIILNSIKDEEYVINLISNIEENKTCKIKKILIYRLKMALAYKKYKYSAKRYPYFKFILRFILSITKKYFRLIAFINNFKI